MLQEEPKQAAAEAAETHVKSVLIFLVTHLVLFGQLSGHFAEHFSIQVLAGFLATYFLFVGFWVCTLTLHQAYRKYHMDRWPHLIVLKMPCHKHER